MRGEVLKHFSRDLCTTSCSFFVRLEDFAQGGTGILPVRTAKMDVPRFGCGSAALCHYFANSLRRAKIGTLEF